MLALLQVVRLIDYSVVCVDAHSQLALGLSEHLPAITCHCVIAWHGGRVGCPGQRRSGHVDRHRRAHERLHMHLVHQRRLTFCLHRQTRNKIYRQWSLHHDPRVRCSMSFCVCAHPPREVRASSASKRATATTQLTLRYNRLHKTSASVLWSASLLLKSSRKMRDRWICSRAPVWFL
jgi:hypothetical protein